MHVYVYAQRRAFFNRWTHFSTKDVKRETNPLSKPYSSAASKACGKGIVAPMTAAMPIHSKPFNGKHRSSIARTTNGLRKTPARYAAVVTVTMSMGSAPVSIAKP